MDEEEVLSKKLTDTLRGVKLDERYYRFFNEIRHHVAASNLKKSDLESVLKEANEAFRYDSKEAFFYTEPEKIGSCEVTLRVRFRNDEAEFILGLKTPVGRGGGPFTRLAREAGLSRDPGFSPKPAAPKLPFTNREQLAEIIRFGLEIYADVVKALQTSDICANKG
jgi:hypothetical protein